MSYDSVYSIEGSLAISLRDISNAGTIFNDISVNIKVVDRLSEGMITAVTPAYYIQLEYDVNSQVVAHDTQDENDENDDTFSLPELTFKNNSVDVSNNVSRLLPTSATDKYRIGTVNFTPASTEVSIEFSSSYVMMELTLDDQGVLSAGNLSFDVDDSDKIYATQANEDLTKATQIYIGETAPTIGDAHPDTSLKGSDLDFYNIYLNQIGQNVTSVYDNKQVIDSWTITINEIPQSEVSQLTRHCRYRLNNNNNNNNTVYFEDGTKFVTSSYSTFAVSIKNINNDDISLVAGSPHVYGVIVQREGVTTGTWSDLE